MSERSAHEATPRGNTAVADETILKTAKEIAVKFIETGRISPATFAETFAAIYQAVDNCVRRKG